MSSLATHVTSGSVARLTREAESGARPIVSVAWRAALIAIAIARPCRSGRSPLALPSPPPLPFLVLVHAFGNPVVPVGVRAVASHLLSGRFLFKGKSDTKLSPVPRVDTLPYCAFLKGK